MRALYGFTKLISFHERRLLDSVNFTDANLSLTLPDSVAYLYVSSLVCFQALPVHSPVAMNAAS